MWCVTFSSPPYNTTVLVCSPASTRVQPNVQYVRQCDSRYAQLARDCERCGMVLCHSMPGVFHAAGAFLSPRYPSYFETVLERKRSALYAILREHASYLRPWELLSLQLPASCVLLRILPPNDHGRLTRIEVTSTQLPSTIWFIIGNQIVAVLFLMSLHIPTTPVGVTVLLLCCLFSFLCGQIPNRYRFVCKICTGWSYDRGGAKT